MLAVLVIFVGVALEIAKANAWFIVPNMSLYIVFGIGVALSIVSIVNGVAAKRRFNSISERVNRFIRR